MRYFVFSTLSLLLSSSNSVFASTTFEPENDLTSYPEPQEFWDGYTGERYFVTTPIVEAAAMGQIGMVERLIHEGADVNARDYSQGQTALFEASQRGYINIVELLLRNGANVNLGNHSGGTPIDRAMNPRIVELLVENGAIVTNEQQVQNHVRADDARIIEILMPRMSSRAVAESLRIASQYGCLRVLSVLIEHRALEIAGGSFTSPTALYTRQDEVVRILILGGADLNQMMEAPFVEYAVPVLRPFRELMAQTGDVFISDPCSSTAELQQIEGLNMEQKMIFAAFRLAKAGKMAEVRRFLLEGLGWNESRIMILERLLVNLVRLECSEIHILYIVSPFLGGEQDMDTLRRVDLGLQYLINSGGSESSAILRSMILRSSTAGFRPVVKALYSMYWQIQQALNRRRIYARELVDQIYSYLNFRDEVMAALDLAIRKHHQARRHA